MPFVSSHGSVASEWCHLHRPARPFWRADSARVRRRSSFYRGSPSPCLVPCCLQWDASCAARRAEENSPAFQRWVAGCGSGRVPQGRKKLVTRQSAGAWSSCVPAETRANQLHFPAMNRRAILGRPCGTGPKVAAEPAPARGPPASFSHAPTDEVISAHPRLLSLAPLRRYAHQSGPEARAPGRRTARFGFRVHSTKNSEEPQLSWRTAAAL